MADITEIVRTCTEVGIAAKKRTGIRIGQAPVFVHCGEVMFMAHLGKFPFVPDMDDCKMIVHADGAVCYIMDTCCRDITKAEKEAIDRQIVQIYLNSEMRKMAKAVPM